MSNKPKYNIELAEKVYELISKKCYFLHEAAKAVDVSVRTLHRWKTPDHKMFKPAFAEMIKIAENEAGDRHMRLAIETAHDDSGDLLEGKTATGTKYVKANNANVARGKLIVETEKWCAGQRNKQWNAVAKVSHSGEVKLPMSVKIIGSFPVPKEKLTERTAGNLLTEDRISKVN